MVLYENSNNKPNNSIWFMFYVSAQISRKVFYFLDKDHLNAQSETEQSI